MHDRPEAGTKSRRHANTRLFRGVSMNDRLRARCGIGAAQLPEERPTEDDWMPMAGCPLWADERRGRCGPKRVEHTADRRRRDERQIHERHHHRIHIVIPLFNGGEANEQGRELPFLIAGILDRREPGGVLRQRGLDGCRIAANHDDD